MPTLVLLAALVAAPAQAQDPRIGAAVQAGVGSVAREVKAQKKANKRIAPDRGLLGTLLRLEMRRNISVLRSYTGFYRKYPEDKNFDRASWAAEKKIQEHLAAVKEDKELSESVLTKRITAILLEATQQMAGFMAMTLSRTAPEPPPLDEDEKSLIEKVVASAKTTGA